MLFVSNIWWKFTSVNWDPSIAIRISLPRLMSLILDPRRFLIKRVWFQQKWVWSNKYVGGGGPLPPMKPYHVCYKLNLYNIDLIPGPTKQVCINEQARAITHCCNVGLHISVLRMSTTCGSFVQDGREGVANTPGWHHPLHGYNEPTNHPRQVTTQVLHHTHNNNNNNNYTCIPTQTYTLIRVVVYS